jgi:hypothetical protein
MSYLSAEDFTSKKVNNPRMLKAGGIVGPGSYTRTRKNTVESPGLLARMAYTARTMATNCSLPDACIPSKFVIAGVEDRMVGQPVPGSPGKTYVKCDEAESARRLANARACAVSNLSTKGGVYGVSGGLGGAGIRPVTPEIPPAPAKAMALRRGMDPERFRELLEAGLEPGDIASGVEAGVLGLAPKRGRRLGYVSY